MVQCKEAYVQVECNKSQWGDTLSKEKKKKIQELDMLGYPEQMQKPGSINTSKTISSLRTVLPRLNISIPQALPTTQSLKMKQI